jgi:hypothetical protein
MQNNTIETYNPAQHKIKIKWFNTNKIKHIKMGVNEEIVKNCTTVNYPANSILIKFHTENHVEVNFMGVPKFPNAVDWWSKRVPRDNVLVYKSSARVPDNNGGYTYVLSKEFNELEFKTGVKVNRHEDSLTLNEMMTYINYIIKQLG